MFRHLIEETRNLLELTRLTRLQAGDKKRASDSAYDSATSGSQERWTDKHSDASAKAGASDRASELAARLSKGKNFKQHKQHKADAHGARLQRDGLSTIKSRIQHGDK